MRVTAFQADKGDCLLVTSANGSLRILADGGMAGAYSEHVAPALARLRRAGHRLDLVYVSHIDQDHIAGVRRLLDDEVAWRVHEHHVANGNPAHPRPQYPRPPRVTQVWHNAFHEQVGDNARPIEQLLAATAPILSASDIPAIRQMAAERRDLATSISDAIRVSRRISPKQLGIPLNPQADGRLMMRRDGQTTVKIGTIRIDVLGPSRTDLRKLRREWNAWLEENAAALEQIRLQAVRDEAKIGQSDLNRFLVPIMLRAKVLGDRSNVTVPNLASLTLLLREGTQSVLLTGDAHGDDILAGLEHAGRLGPGGRLHVDVLKVQHHGAEHNIDARFCDAMTAREYIFCGNGAHGNPDLDVVHLIAERRFAAGGSARFRFWFTSSAESSGKPAFAAHMAEVERRLRRLETLSHGRLSSRFLRTGSSLRVV
jgi:beta-lactamase superfamily II metal-dependent hydrolase